MKTWQIRDWLSTECCAIDGAVQVETDYTGDLVCDGDQARCVRCGIMGTVAEREGHMTIHWDETVPGLSMDEGDMAARLNSTPPAEIPAPACNPLGAVLRAPFATEADCQDAPERKCEECMWHYEIAVLDADRSDADCASEAGCSNPGTAFEDCERARRDGNCSPEGRLWKARGK